MSAFCQYAPYELAEGDWDSRRDEIAAMILDAIAVHAPDLHDCVESFDLLGPPDIESRIGLTGGNIFQGEALPDQMWEHRLDHRTPVEGLYLCGAATHPAGSVIALNGRNAAMAVLQDAGVPSQITLILSIFSIHFFFSSFYFSFIIFCYLFCSPSSFHPLSPDFLYPLPTTTLSPAARFSSSYLHYLAFLPLTSSERLSPLAFSILISTSSVSFSLSTGLLPSLGSRTPSSVTAAAAPTLSPLFPALPIVLLSIHASICANTAHPPKSPQPRPASAPA